MGFAKIFVRQLLTSTKKATMDSLDALNISPKTYASILQLLNDLDSEKRYDVASASYGGYTKIARPTSDFNEDVDKSAHSHVVVDVPIFCFLNEISQHARTRRQQANEKFASRTLLQALFPRSTNTQANQQTLHQVDSTYGHVHVTQLWAVIVSGDGEGTRPNNCL